MSDLKELFEKRDNAHAEATKKIFESIQHVTEGIIEFVDENEPQKEEEGLGEFSWDDVVYFLNEIAPETGGIVLVVGSFNYNLGTTITLPNNEEIEINEDTVNYFKRIIRIGVPLTLAETGTKEEVMEFLQSSMQPDQDEEQEPPENLIKGFNVEGLTEDQQNVLKMSMHLGGLEKN